MRTRPITLIPEHEPQLIWADRLAIVAWLLTGGLVGLVYAAWGDPGTFVLFEKVMGVGIGSMWFVARVLDWGFAGRVR